MYKDFCSRHVGSVGASRQTLIKELGYERIDHLIEDAVPESIRGGEALELRKSGELWSCTSPCPLDSSQ